MPDGGDDAEADREAAGAAVSGGNSYVIFSE